MKTETEWQARALEVVDKWYDDIRASKYELRDSILTFAREYAAEALAEVERLKIERWDEHIRVLKENVDLRAQLAAAGPVKVPDKEWLVDHLLDCQNGHASCRYTADAIRAEVLRLNAAPPKDKP